MRKKLVVLAMVALITLVVATPALAGHGGPGGNGNGGGGQPQLFALVGTITAIGSDTITVEVVDGSRLVWPYIEPEQELTVHVTTSTSYFEWYVDGRVPITFDAVEVGDSTSIHGTVAGDVFTADWVTVDVPCVP